MSYMQMDSYGKDEFEQLDNFFKVLRLKEDIWLFGVGNYGKAFYNYLKISNIQIAGFVVSSVNEIDEYDGHIIVDIEKFRSIYRSDKSLLLLTIGSKYYAEVYPKVMFMKDDVRFIPSTWLECAIDRCGDFNRITLIIPVADYCEGIACYGCTVAAPIAEKTFYLCARFKKDLSRLKKVIGGEVDHINFSGGDIFLNPEFVEMVEYARKLFPVAKIDASTNGILFNRQTDNVWKRLADCDISLNWTLYPIEYEDMSEVTDRMLKLGIKLNIIGDTCGEDKNSWKIPYTTERQNDYDWLFCRFHKDNNQCLTLWNGMLGVCFLIRRVKWIKSCFQDCIDKNVKESIMQEKVGLDLYSVVCKEEIHSFMTQKMEICDFCNIRGRCSMGKWLPSNGAYSEWFS